MSEPESVFVKLKISREALTRWLHAKPSPATRWQDWRTIGGEWYLGRGHGPLADASDDALESILRGADDRLARFSSNRELLGMLLIHSAEAPELWLSAFDQGGENFVAGSLTYSENLEDFIVFLALARGVADYLGPADHGHAIVHNYIWGSEEEQETTAALQMLPSGESRLLPDAEQPEVAAIFLPVADALMEGQLPPGFCDRDELALST